MPKPSSSDGSTSIDARRVERLTLGVADVAPVLDAAGERGARAQAAENRLRLLDGAARQDQRRGSGRCARPAARRRRSSIGRFLRGSIVPTNRIGPGRSRSRSVRGQAARRAGRRTIRSAATPRRALDLARRVLGDHDDQVGALRVARRERRVVAADLGAVRSG